MNYTTGLYLWEGAQPGILKAGEVHRKSGKIPQVGKFFQK